jgi:FMN reductase
MSSVLLVAASPAADSRTAGLARLVGEWLHERGCESSLLELRTLPPEALIAARGDHPAIAATLQRVEQADGLVLCTPIYKASFAGLLKVWLDLLPQYGLRGKTVLPLATGGSLAHALAIDYGLRPVLCSMEPRHIAAGWFVVDRLLEKLADGGVRLDPDTAGRLRELVDRFVEQLPGPSPLEVG